MQQAHPVVHHDEPNDLILQLQQKFTEAFDPAAVFGLQIAHYEGESIALAAPLSKNRNDKGSAFAGSLYSVGVLTGWSLLYLKLVEEGMDCNVVVVKSQTRYLRPLLDDLQAECQITPLQLKRFLWRLRRRGRAGIDLDVTIRTATHTSTKLRVKYAAICRGAMKKAQGLSQPSAPFRLVKKADNAG